MVYVGIDAGSRTIKIVMIDGDDMSVIARSLVDQGVEQVSLAKGLYEKMLKINGINPSDVAKVIATGYGRNALDWANTTVTEITCHATGVKHQHPNARTIIDIGGQDNKLIRLSESGSVRDFSMNDRCAAGTGRFLEVVSDKLEIKLSDLGKIAAKANKPSVISSMCVVFAETEIISLLASGETPENIASGVQASIAKRIASMSGGKVEDDIIFTGGAALVPGMKEALSIALKCSIIVASDPKFTGAMGAALIAAKEDRNRSNKLTTKYCEVK
ncbi:MAG: rod shape-determining protein [Candidatus Omnitrophica bacterium]|nr:rod shape-determining protein [Candidatus Omnitrophota bacterium]